MSEQSELLVVYDNDLHPIGTETRAVVHDKCLLHQTIRMCCVYADHIWLQQRALTKSVFPGRFDFAATGHIGLNETPEQAALRETKEEIGLDLVSSNIEFLGAIPFAFTRQDGKLDNEYANIFLYRPDKKPCFRIGEEVLGIVSITVDNYDTLVRTGRTVPAKFYDEGLLTTPAYIACTPNDFCCLNAKEWDLIQSAIGR